MIEARQEIDLRVTIMMVPTNTNSVMPATQNLHTAHKLP